MSAEHAVESVERVEDSEGIFQKFFEILKSREYIETLYNQCEWREGDRVLRKLITIGDLKSCEKGIIYREKDFIVDRYLFTSINSFKQVFKRSLYRLPKQVYEKCGTSGFLSEVYATVVWFLDRGAYERSWWSVISEVDDFRNSVFVPVAYDFIIDIDLGENPWINEEDGLKKLLQFCDFMNEKLGLEPQVLVSKGVQLRVTLLPLHLLQLEAMGIEKWPTIVMKKLPKIHKKIAIKLVQEFYNIHNTKIIIDTQVYDPSRITRLGFSIHSGIMGFSIPFKPYMLENLSWDRIRKLQKSPDYIISVIKKVKDVSMWGRSVRPEIYQRILEFFLALEGKNLKLNIDVPIPKKNIREYPTPTGWRKISDPILGEIEYDARLEGFGWVETLIKERIPIPDGRLAFCWSILPVVVKGPKTKDGQLPPLTSKEDAVEWLRKSLEKYPDPEKTLEDYIEKLEYNLKYGDKYNIPTWKHLIEEKSENGERIAEVFLHIKYPVMYSLYLHNYIKLSQDHVEKIRKLINS